MCANHFAINMYVAMELAYLHQFDFSLNRNSSWCIQKVEVIYFIEIMKKSHGYYYDWRQLERWNISEKDLPTEAQALYKQPTFLELYLTQIIVGSILIIIGVSFLWILALLNEIKARRAAERRLNKQNEELEHLAVTDRLTGLFNRVKLDHILQQSMSSFKRYKRPFSVIIMDLDHFKNVNDTYGHPTGDAVLKTVSAIITDNLRQIDTVGRWGGEEFMIVCPETSPQGAIALAEKLRKLIESHSFISKITITASFGLSEARTGDDETHLIQRADDALYKAKQKGRNRIECS